MAGVAAKFLDAILFLFFLLIAVAAPLLDGQTCLPRGLYPTFLVDLKNWYSSEFGDYLVDEKPRFFVGLVWVELLFQWPLALVCLYGIAAGKSWLNNTCLVYGASLFTSMVSILSELSMSEKASEKLLKMYYPFVGIAVLTILRGFLPNPAKASSMGKRPAMRKKRA